MKHRGITLCLAILFSCAPFTTVSAQPAAPSEASPKDIFTNRSIEQAWRTSVARKKPLLVMFKSERCMYCTKMLKETFGHPAIKRWLGAHTETVLADAEIYKVLVQRLGIRGYPTTLVVSPQGKVQDIIEGYVDPDELAERVGPFLTSAAKSSAVAPALSVAAQESSR